MNVTISLEAPLIFTGDPLEARVTFDPGPSLDDGEPPPPVHLLSGSAYLETSLRLGPSFNPEFFKDLKIAAPALHAKPGDRPGGGLLGEMWGGFKNLVYHNDDDDNEDGLILYRTAQYLLFTDSYLTSTKVFNVQLQLPDNLPPTYSSQSLEIQHTIIVSFQSLTPKGVPGASELRMPFRVFPAPRTDPYDLTKVLESSSTHVRPVFVDDLSTYIEEILGGNKDATPDSFPIPTHLLKQELGKLSYQFAKDGVVLATLVLPKSPLQLGEMLFGVMTFQRPCAHVALYLELEETVSDDVVAANSKAKSSRVFSKQHVSCLGIESLSVHLPIPFSAAAQFDSDQISASWNLRIELVGLREPAFDQTADAAVAKDVLSTEFISTKVPLRIAPPSTGGQSTQRVWSFLQQ